MKTFFLERKDHLIRKHPDFNTLSLEQQKHLIDYFSNRDKTPNLDIDWNKLASYNIQDVLKATYELSKTGKEKAVKKSGIKGLEKGKDYLEFPTPSSNIKAYIPLNYEASRLIASTKVGPCEGKWCTAYQKTDEHWNEYSTQGIIFIYIITPKTKYAITVAVDNELEIYDATDKTLSVEALNNRLKIDIETLIQQNRALTEQARSYIAEMLARKKRENLKYLDGSIPVPNKDIIKEFIDSDLDISRLDVSHITDMSYLFRNSKFNGDISNWDVSNVTNMAGMFRLATSFNSDISNWDVSNVTDMSGMFSFAENFNGDISDWNVSNVTNMTEMFYFAKSFNGDISNWDISNVIDARVIFKGSPLERRYPNGLDDLKKEQRLKENALKDWLYEEFLW